MTAAYRTISGLAHGTGSTTNRSNGRRPVILELVDELAPGGVVDFLVDPDFMQAVKVDARRVAKEPGDEVEPDGVFQRDVFVHARVAL